MVSKHGVLQTEVKGLTVSLWPIFQAERQSQGGIVFKELSGESIPPQVITLLKHTHTHTHTFQS